MRILNLFPANEQAELYNKNSIFKHKLLILLNSFIIKIFNPDFTDSKLYKNLSFYCTTLVYNASFKLNLPQQPLHHSTAFASKADLTHFQRNTESKSHSAANFAD